MSGVSSATSQRASPSPATRAPATTCPECGCRATACRHSSCAAETVSNTCIARSVVNEHSRSFTIPAEGLTYFLLLNMFTHPFKIVSFNEIASKCFLQGEGQVGAISCHCESSRRFVDSSSKYYLVQASLHGPHPRGTAEGDVGTAASHRTHQVTATHACQIIVILERFLRGDTNPCSQSRTG